MEYAFKCFFSEQTGAPIREIWQELADRGLSSFLMESGSTPGVTLGVCKGCESKDLEALAHVFSQEVRGFGVETWGIGSFLTDPAHVFLGVTLSSQLNKIHGKFLEMVEKVAEVSHYYKKGNWVPHSTIAIRCQPEVVPEVVAIGSQFESQLKCWADSVAVVEIGSAREICRFPLRTEH